MEKQTSSLDSMSKCNDTTGESTKNTSAETARSKPTNDSATAPKQSEPNETQSVAASQRSAAVYREFLITDLKNWTLTDIQRPGFECSARHCPADIWVQYFSEYADLDPAADWSDMEERADFLTQLWTFCTQQKLNFPLTEKLTQNTTVS